MPLAPPLEQRLAEFTHLLVNQQAARTIVPPMAAESGYWFGGGNTVELPDGDLLVVGRYRNFGDSRTGLGKGERGLELALFRSTDRGNTFTKALSFSKEELNVSDRSVYSIEGSALRLTTDGIELFVSTEKSNLPYPTGLESFLKPGTGVWTIERLFAPSWQELKAAPVETVLETDDSRFVHLKDPFVYDSPGGASFLLFCSHPFCWSSSNTGYAVRQADENTFAPPVFEHFPRGYTWDVAMTRGTCVLDVPPVGPFAGLNVSLIFYDGGESLRNMDEHQQAVTRPRGYSCEEIGGVGYFLDGNLQEISRLSLNLPFFISPYGTGCSRYVDVCPTKDGFFTTWQQSQEDCSQPLVMNFVARDEAEKLLATQ